MNAALRVWLTFVDAQRVANNKWMPRKYMPTDNDQMLMGTEFLIDGRE